MKNTTGERVLVLALLACLSACADPVTRSTEPAISRDITANTAPLSPTPEQSALTKITRLVALAMDNEPARQHLLGKAFGVGDLLAGEAGGAQRFVAGLRHGGGVAVSRPCGNWTRTSAPVPLGNAATAKRNVRASMRVALPVSVADPP